MPCLAINVRILRAAVSLISIMPFRTQLRESEAVQDVERRVDARPAHAVTYAVG